MGLNAGPDSLRIPLIWRTGGGILAALRNLDAIRAEMRNQIRGTHDANSGGGNSLNPDGKATPHISQCQAFR